MSCNGEKEVVCKSAVRPEDVSKLLGQRSDGASQAGSLPKVRDNERCDPTYVGTDSRQKRFANAVDSAQTTTRGREGKDGAQKVGFDFSQMWTRPATYQTCVVECGGKCCSLNLNVFMTKGEAVRLANLAGGLITMSLHRERAHHQYAMNIKGGCQFLKDGACSIHEDRPGACRNFPHRPVEGCAVWSV